MRIANPETDKPSATIVNLTEIRLKRTFCELLNEFICFYNKATPSDPHKEYYCSSIYTKLTIARGFEWHCIADLIQAQIDIMSNGGSPRAIDLKQRRISK